MPGLGGSRGDKGSGSLHRHEEGQGNFIEKVEAWSLNI